MILAPKESVKNIRTFGKRLILPLGSWNLKFLEQKWHWVAIYILKGLNNRGLSTVAIKKPLKLWLLMKKCFLTTENRSTGSSGPLKWTLSAKNLMEGVSWLAKKCKEAIIFSTFLGRIWWIITRTNFLAQNMLKYSRPGRALAQKPGKIVIFESSPLIFLCEKPLKICVL
jgi:hypothetical protein